MHPMVVQLVESFTSDPRLAEETSQLTARQRALAKRRKTDIANHSIQLQIILERASKYRMLSPHQVSSLKYAYGNKYGVHYRTLEAAWDDMQGECEDLDGCEVYGVYQGKALIHRDEFLPLVKRLVGDVWWASYKSKSAWPQNRVEIAIMLALLGDRNAIRNSKSGNLRGRKAVNSTNHP